MSRIICLAVFLSGCATPPDSTVVENIRFVPSAFDSFRRNAELKFSVASPSAVTITIVRKDSLGNEQAVRILIENLYESKGSHSVTWLGDSDNRLFAPAGMYFGVVESGENRFEAPVTVFHF